MLKRIKRYFRDYLAPVVYEFRILHLLNLYEIFKIIQLLRLLFFQLLLGHRFYLVCFLVLFSEILVAFDKFLKCEIRVNIIFLILCLDFYQVAKDIAKSFQGFQSFIIFYLLTRYLLLNWNLNTIFKIIFI